MKILIYDDQQKDIENLKNCIQIFFQKKNIEYTLSVCKNSDELYRNAFTYDIIFLDIEIGEENGIELGMQLRNLACQSRIIIVSQFSKYLIEGYKIQADRYFIKPITQDVFEAEMENVISNYFKQHVGFIDSSISKTKIYLKDILYIEYLDRKSVLHFINKETITTTYPLKHWLEQLQGFAFAQPHKSFIVNFTYIKKFDTQDILLTNNERIPLSRHYKKNFEMEYIKNLHKAL